MGLLSSILLAPFTGPIDAAMWTMEKVQRVVEDQLADDTPIKEELFQLQLSLDAGEIDDDEYMVREAEIMQKLRDVREWRERLGRSVGGGPVRVARPTDADVSVELSDDVSPDGSLDVPRDASSDDTSRDPSNGR